jgi:mannose/fructose/N-acetylgalactosamine-specific phosphotransferase system component IIB
MTMSVVLFRIDERLIHGQVVVGWGGELHPDHIVVIDDALAASEWEQELYCLGLPPEVTAEFVGLDTARALLDEWQRGGRRVVVLVRDATTMLGLASGGLMQGTEVNVGGIHHAPGRREVLPYLFLSPEESASLRELAEEGVDVSARDLPGTRRVPLSQLVRDDGAA